ncbi:MAG TPA: hypothetical protein VK790_02840 [Solirubrobacteraceae bacterium]|nr:hypothetical protein [Solirubrobacteraceae bacterium]
MGRNIAAALACSALVLATGCGSSGGGTASSTAGSTTTQAANSNAKTGSASGSTPSPEAGSLKVDKAPKFAKPSPTAPTQSGIVQIAYRNIAIEPDTVRVKVGTTIRWTNYDSVQANVTSVGGPQHIASKDFGEGGTFEVKVHTPGLIHYECTLYPVTMNGTIEVVS